MAPRQLAEATDYHELIAAFRNRAAELQVSGETIDEVAGLPCRYAAKLLGPNAVRRVGAISLGPLLGALGIKLVVVEDENALRQLGSRLKKRNSNLVRAGSVHVVLTDRFMRKIRKIGGANSRKYLGKRKVKQLARKAARARWSKPRIVEVTERL
jgi:hypothetical protein